MKKHVTILVSLLFVVVSIFLASNALAACTAITKLPATLTTGNWCLTGNLSSAISTQSNAITINGDDVVFDLSGFEIKNTITGPAIGIGGATGRKNITIKNGRIIGYGSAIEIGFPSAPVTNVVIDGISALDILSNGIAVTGQSAIIRNCVATGGGGGNTIIVAGSNNSIINNDVFSLSGSGAIYVDESGTGSFGNIVENNRITCPGPNCSGATGIGIGVNNVSVLVINNRIRNMTTGIIFERTTTGKMRDNVTLNCTTPFDAPADRVVDLGNNN